MFPTVKASKPHNEVERVTVGWCEPRFWQEHARRRAVVKIGGRFYCEECLRERVRNDANFAAEMLVHLLVRL